MANWITLIRTVMCLLVAYLLFAPSYKVYLACFALTVLVIMMDSLDGYVARKFNESSRAGAVIDILGDRIVEQVYWIVFLALGWVPLAVPLIVIVRGVLVDGLRSIAFEQGYTAFGETSMQQSPLGTFLVSSRYSRWLYAFFKATAFALLILGHTPALSPEIAVPINALAYVSVYIAVIFCVIRGLPVIIEGRRFLTPASKA